MEVKKTLQYPSGKVFYCPGLKVCVQGIWFWRWHYLPQMPYLKCWRIRPLAISWSGALFVIEWAMRSRQSTPQFGELQKSTTSGTVLSDFFWTILPSLCMDDRRITYFFDPWLKAHQHSLSDKQTLAFLSRSLWDLELWWYKGFVSSQRSYDSHFGSSELLWKSVIYLWKNYHRSDSYQSRRKVEPVPVQYSFLGWLEGCGRSFQDMALMWAGT